jgi:hypothetical protein
MPVSPADAALLGKGLLEIYSDAELQLLDLIGRAITRGIDTPSWREHQLIAVQTLRAQTLKLTKDLEKAGTKAAGDAVLAGYNRGAAVAGIDLARLGGSTTGAFGGVDTRAVQALTSAAGDQIRDTGLVIRSQQEAIYRDVVQQTAGRQLTAGMTRRDASWDAMQTWADRGVTGFVDRAGRSWSMTSYAEMIGRTAATQAIMQGHRDRLVDAGRDLVMISDAPEECERCRPWEGKVLSLTGQTRAGTYTAAETSYVVAGTLAQATAAGLFHPNCRHRTTAYLPGITPPLLDTEDPEGDKLRQQQRYRERHIRELKRKAQTARTMTPNSPAAAIAAKRLRTAQADFKVWRDVNGRKDLAYRTSIKTPTARPVAPRVPDVPAELVPDPKPKRTPRTPPADMRDWNTRELRTASDADIEAALQSALAEDHPGADRIITELDRRDSLPMLEAQRAERRRLAVEAQRAKRADTRAAAMQAKAGEVTRRIDAGEDPRSAYADVMGVSIEKQLKAEAFQRLKASGSRGDTLDQMIRSDYNDEVYRLWNAAEDDCRGQLLNREGEAWNAKHADRPGLQIDPLDLFTGPEKRARKWASDELKAWWDRNGRPTLEQYRAQVISGTQKRERGTDDFLV